MLISTLVCFRTMILTFFSWKSGKKNVREIILKFAEQTLS